ncbi:hypothetical protein [Bifidobacterium sp.]|uniref:hypothetical protein n=1 Tax=Bifidobacterium sp. TaxID=41200 RepID=UPI004026E176
MLSGRHPASTGATDPSDPDANQKDDETLPDDRSVTIYCKPADSSWKSPKTGPPTGFVLATVTFDIAFAFAASHRKKN